MVISNIGELFHLLVTLSIKAYIKEMQYKFICFSYLHYVWDEEKCQFILNSTEWAWVNFWVIMEFPLLHINEIRGKIPKSLKFVSKLLWNYHDKNCYILQVLENIHIGLTLNFFGQKKSSNWREICTS